MPNSPPHRPLIPPQPQQMLRRGLLVHPSHSHTYDSQPAMQTHNQLHTCNQTCTHTRTTRIEVCVYDGIVPVLNASYLSCLFDYLIRYELQLEPSLQRQGIGRFLMSLVRSHIIISDIHINLTSVDASHIRHLTHFPSFVVCLLSPVVFCFFS